MSGWSAFDHFRLGEEYDTPLLDLELYQGDEKLRGSGRLRCRPDGHHELWVLTTGGNRLPQSKPLQLGSMMSESSYLRLKALDSRSEVVEIRRLHLNCVSSTSDANVVWKSFDGSFNSDVIISRQNQSSHENDTFGTLILNAHVEKTDGSWLREGAAIVANTEFGNVHVSGIRRNRLCIAVTCNDESDIAKCCLATCHAIGFMSGDCWRVEIEQIVANGQESIRIPVPRQQQMGKLLSPLGPYNPISIDGSVFSTLLEKSTSYLAKDESITSQQYLCSLWNSVDRSFSVSALIACSVLEGLCPNDTEPIPKSITEVQIARVLELLRSDGFSIELCGRIQGLLPTLNRQSASNRLSHWCRSGKFGLSIPVFKGWNRLRNLPAHGRFDLFEVPSEERAKLIAARNAVYQGINLMLLSKMGYEGPVFDWISGTFR